MKNKKWITKKLMVIILSAIVGLATPLSITMSVAASETSDTSTDTENKEIPPTGEMPDGNGGPGGTPPSGEKPEGTPPEKPEGDSNADSGSMPGGAPGGGADTQSFDFSGSYAGVLIADNEEVTSDGETYSSETADENVALTQNGGTLTITGGTLNKSGSDENGDNCNFYGLNSIVLSVGEDSMTYIDATDMTADGTGSNGIFATDSGTVYANGSSISTTADNSRGLDATYDGTIIANDMTIDTKGEHCAGVATDRGGGNVSVTNSTINTAGSGSPILYSTGDIQAKNITGTATGSQLAAMEGYNTIMIYDSDLTSTKTGASASDKVANGVLIYQSTSGDADTSTGEGAVFNAVDSTLKSAIEEGAFFYVTNTSGDIVLKNTTLDFDSTKAELLKIEGNDTNNWGTPGKNGGNIVFTAYNETLTGDITVDTISSLDFYLLDGSTYTGNMEITENENGSTSESPIIVNIEKGASWVVTADTTISGLNAEDGATIVDSEGKTVTIVAGGETVVSGDSELTVTVTGEYTNTVTTDQHNELSEEYIDRSDFDSYYGTSTSFTASTNANEQEETATATEPAEASEQEVVSEEKGKNLPLIAGGVIVAAALIGGGCYIIKKKK